MSGFLIGSLIDLILSFLFSKSISDILSLVVFNLDKFIGTSIELILSVVATRSIRILIPKMLIYTES